ncbi:cyclase [Mesorhizobium tianshanense]|uniref:Putative cyclase n=1 Tax=Mesorhizobium tianshanense TaxID=39844 RepID=A0A562P2Y1_9HYPH|nr:cyclase family protein [Mesorhizobium tianshanense]TWI38759.1 putative cyclase [Mesorhizobium tianshanense]GLS36693.1 cyclase [Mesorhizobium tianshanense]
MHSSQARPSYDELRGDDRSPPGSSWPFYGQADQIGSIGLLDADCVIRAASLVTKGAVFSLNWSLDLPDPALFGRKRLKHSICFDHAGADDIYDDFFPQSSTQWDSLGHIRHPVHGYYQGHQEASITGREGSRLGIEHWAERGIAGRFVLADLERFRRALGRPIRPGDSDAITIHDLEACLRSQETKLLPGDILLLRFGWVHWYEQADRETRNALADSEDFAACGLSRSEETARWIWNKSLSAVAGDNPALEVQPFDTTTTEGFLHYRLIPLLGTAIGEMFALDALARDCEQDGRYEGLFVSAPLNKLGGVGSPANALALK